MKYLTLESILLIHTALVEETGGSAGVRDLPTLKSAEHLPKQSFGGAELYPTVFHKAAVYARTVMMDHPFVDGNKRTGMMLALTFLEENDFLVIARKDEIWKFAVSIVTKKRDIENIASWLKRHSKKAL